MNTVAQPPHRDGKQPGSALRGPSPVQAAPLPNPHVETVPMCGNSGVERGHSCSASFIRRPMPFRATRNGDQVT